MYEANTHSIGTVDAADAVVVVGVAALVQTSVDGVGRRTRDAATLGRVPLSVRVARHAHPPSEAGVTSHVSTSPRSLPAHLCCGLARMRYPCRHATLQRVPTSSSSLLQLDDSTVAPVTFGRPHIGSQYASGTDHVPSAWQTIVLSEPGVYVC